MDELGTFGQEVLEVFLKCFSSLIPRKYLLTTKKIWSSEEKTENIIESFVYWKHIYIFFSLGGETSQNLLIDKIITVCIS